MLDVSISCRSSSSSSTSSAAVGGVVRRVVRVGRGECGGEGQGVG